MDDQSYLRNIPKQSRSLKRFHDILDVADALFAQHGYDVVSTNHIADGAGIPIGSVYHFFPDKETILHALLDRYRERLHEVFPKQISPPRTIADILDEMMTNLLAFGGQYPNFDQLLLNGDIEKEYALHRQITKWVGEMLGVQFPELSSHARDKCAKTGVAMMVGIFTLMNPPFHLSADELNLQARLALTGYLKAFLHREKINEMGRIGTIF
ncbi:MAG: TetR/AcrR family transcriptional regulator [bacterium]|nr:TetR/AcrR family transcriptional regulator [bacterium]